MSRHLRPALGVARHEAAMMLRRKGVWVAYALLLFFYGSMLLMALRLNPRQPIDPARLWPAAAQAVYQYNMFMTLVAGILAADCLHRDYRTGVIELQRSSPLGFWPLLAGKYAGTLAALLLPYLVLVLIIGGAMVALQLAPPMYPLALLAAYLAMAVPAHAFVLVFSLACPLMMPVRVFQILFTGYWFWGNYLNPKALPTLNGTLLTPSGVFMARAYFGGFNWSKAADYRSPAQAWLNLLVLTAIAAAMLFALRRYLRWREQAE